MYGHITVNHNNHFVDPLTGANTQRVERMWRALKEKNKRMQGIRRWQADSYVCEFLLQQLWRRNGKSPFEGTLELIRSTNWNLIP